MMILDDLSSEPWEPFFAIGFAHDESELAGGLFLLIDHFICGAPPVEEFLLGPVAVRPQPLHVDPLRRVDPQTPKDVLHADPFDYNALTCRQKVSDTRGKVIEPEELKVAASIVVEKSVDFHVFGSESACKLRCQTTLAATVNAVDGNKDGPVRGDYDLEVPN